MFIRISVPIVEAKKKSVLINDWESTTACREQSKQEQDIDQQVWFLANTVEGSGGTTPRAIL